MKIKYIDSFRKLVISGEDCLIIPTNKEKSCINIKTESIDRMVEKHGLTLKLENFVFYGTKTSLKDKIKIIFRIIML